MIGDPLFLAAILFGPFVYWLLPKNLRSPFLVLLSGAYLGWRAPLPTAAIFGWTTLFVWLAPKARTASRPKTFTAGLILLILGWLAAFKYVPVIVDTLTTSRLEASILLPVGISYYSFKLVHYAVEVNRDRIEKHSIFDALVWTTLFPAFTAGPIERFDHFLANRAEKPSEAMVATGLTRILHGLVKKLFLADTVLLPLAGDIEHMLGHLPEFSTPQIWAFLMLMFLWSYLDFSAYSDIAIGASRLFGIELMENFNWPILATNLSKFWQRWHMSLAAWCQSYVYMPTIGLTRNPFLSAYATFVVMGLWHGAGLNWICWGLYHGTGIAIHVSWTRYKRRRKWHKRIDKHPLAFLGAIPTMCFVGGASAFTITADYGGWAGMRMFAKAFFLDI